MELAMLMQKSGAATASGLLQITAIAAGIRTATAQHAMETFAIQTTKNGVRIMYGKQDQTHNTALGAAIQTRAAPYARAMHATGTIEDGAQIPRGPL